MGRLHWLAGCALPGVLLACDALLDVEMCGKHCSTASDCGGSYACTDGVCAGEPCGSGVTDPAGTGSSSGGQVGTSSGGATSGASSHGSGHSSSAPASSAAVVSCMNGSTPRPGGTACGTGQVCDGQGSCRSGCWIGGQLVSPGPAPGAPCRACVPTTDTTDWSNAPAGSPCTDQDACTTDACNGNGQCASQPKCTGSTPTCIPATGACRCSNNPNSCSTDPAGSVCRAMSGQCGCFDSGDCPAGTACDLTTRTCGPCNTPDACGDACDACRNAAGMTLNEGSYWTCTSTSLPADQACQPVACDATRANCNGDDSDQCEVNLADDPDHCGACALQCDSGSCVQRQCTCPSGDWQCPMNQGCGGSGAGRCRCGGDNECPGPLYTCNNSTRICER
ncbi:MAG: hypothetical protein HY904_21670 [Deltaproteobacteria bacterium]|nr:hypothetical protein [Deltaproteobacteria bacterium]